MATIGRTYLRLLRTHTLVTQMGTAGVVFGLGDFLSQKAIERKPWHVYDTARTFRFFTYGSILWAPITNRWFFLTNSMVQFKSFPATVAGRVGADMFVYSPFNIAYFFVVMGLLERRPLEDIKTRLRDHWFNVYATSVLVFGPTQIINMSLMPLYARPPFVNIVSLGWNCYLAGYNHRAKTVTLQEDQLLAAKMEAV